MRNVLRRWFRHYFSDPQVLVLVLILAAGFLVVKYFGRMLVPVFTAVVLAVLMDGLIGWLKRFDVRRDILVYLVFILFLVVFADLVIIVLPLVMRQVGELFHDLPVMVAMVKRELLSLPARYPGLLTEETIHRTIALIGDEFESFAGNIIKVSVISARGAVEAVVYLVLVPFLVFFMLKDKELIAGWFSSIMPEERGLATLVWNEVYDQFFNYLRGKVLEIIFVWAINYAAFSVIGLKYSVILSLFVGIAVLVPYVGAAVMFIPVTLVAFFQWGFGSHTIWTVIAYIVLHALDGNIVAPLLLSKVVRIHPIGIITAILIFGGLWGFWGLVFAIPLATLIHSVFKAWVKSAQALQDNA